MKCGEKITFLHVLILMYIFTKNNVHYSASLMMYIGGKMDKHRAYNNAALYFSLARALILFTFSYDSHKMAVIPY